MDGKGSVRCVKPFLEGKKKYRANYKVWENIFRYTAPPMKTVSRGVEKVGLVREVSWIAFLGGVLRRVKIQEEGRKTTIARVFEMNDGEIKLNEG